MNKTEIEQFKHKLLSLRSELQDLEKASIEAAKPVELDQAGMGRLSLMSAMIAQRRSEEGSRLPQRQLLKIEGALRRIESGEYGKCFMCEEDIEAQRLSVDPTDTRCMKCIEE
ncbi:MAG: TraR/DksA family transcriptional regulator [Nitrospirae bacterium]|nr:TraR/DksA family transcriptional regulator [Nitrospirota bacterium]